MAKFKYKVNGVELTEEQWQASLPPTPKRRRRRKKAGVTFMTAPAKAWPMVSDGAGVDPTQIEEAKALAKSQGVTIDFNHEGQAIFRSRAHRREYCRLRGLHDRNGGYGDP